MFNIVRVLDVVTHVAFILLLVTPPIPISSFSSFSLVPNFSTCYLAQSSTSLFPLLFSLVLLSDSKSFLPGSALTTITSSSLSSSSSSSTSITSHQKSILVTDKCIMGRNWKNKRKQNPSDEKPNVSSDIKKYAHKKSAPKSNPKMEAYYAFQGLHSQRKTIIEDRVVFVPCKTNDEKEEERKLWIKSLRQILPASFRIGQDINSELREQLKQELDKFVGKEFEIVVDQDDEIDLNRSSSHIHEQNLEKKVESKEENFDRDSNPVETFMKKVGAAKKIPYIPHAYQLSIDRRTIRRNSSLKDFHSWLHVQSESGFLNRQETVSMIPPIVLSPEPHHSVLDMCAAPGSKTSQLLEMVGKIQPGMLEPQGYVVANDSDAKRAGMLVSHLRRHNNPAVLVTSLDARVWPLLLENKVSTDEDCAKDGMFDRVLCDVPCSGDGTARKNAGIWRYWSASSGLSVHPLQLKIAMKGADLTKVGGYMCYSTCSMNPIENEAVVAEILRSSNGSLVLVDKRPDMPGLQVRSGWNHWKVMLEEKSNTQIRKALKKKRIEAQKKLTEQKENNNNTDECGMAIDFTIKDELLRNTHDEKIKTANKREQDILQSEEDKINRNTMNKGIKHEPDITQSKEDYCFGWDDDELLQRAQATGLVHYNSFDDVPDLLKQRVTESCFPPSQEEVKRFNLQKCFRCLPHDMDTGGFFVALFKKNSHIKNSMIRKDNQESTLVLEKEYAETSGGENKNCLIDVNVSSKMKQTSDMNNKIVNKTDTTSNGLESNQQSDERCKVSNNECFTPLDEDFFTPLIDFFGFKASLPIDQLMAKTSGEVRTVYFITNRVKRNIMNLNYLNRLNVIHSGLRAFERNNRVCEVKYRPVQECIHFLAPYMTKRKLLVDDHDFEKCLEPGAIKCELFSAKFAKEVRALVEGPFVVILKDYENDISKKMISTMWRFKSDNVDCFVSIKEMDGLKNKLKALTAT